MGVTSTAEADDLEALRDEARRSGVSLNSVLQEIIARRAEELRAAKRPRLGLGHGGGFAKSSVDDEDAPAASAYRG